MKSDRNLKLGVPRETLYETVIDGLAEGVFLLDLETMEIVDANPAIARMLGYTVDELTSLRVYDIVAHAARDVDRTAELTLANGQHLLPRRRFRARDGRVLQVEVTVNQINVSGRPAAFAIVRDIAEKIAFERRLQDTLHYDAMTGLPTSLALREHAEEMIALCRKKQGRLACIVLDLNKFSAINQRFGLTVGDQVITHVGHRLSMELKDCEMVARLQGGDEFGVLCRVDNDNDAGKVIDRILEILDKPVDLENEPLISVMPSIGAAVYPDHGATFDELVHHAGIARKRARTERLQSVLYDVSYEPFGDFGFDIAIELPHALNENKLFLLFQPIVAAGSTGACVGAEALVRWNHEKIGLIPPAYFVPEAEEANIVTRLDKWVIEQVIRQIAAWQKNFPDIWVSANVSAQTLGASDILEWVTSTLRDYKVSPKRLMLEVTETAAMLNRDSVVKILDRLRTAGIRIALDDFGTGYSSLAYLKHIPVDVVKIDREFVAGIGADARDENTVRTIATLLQGIDCALLAEGVETEEQYEWLKKIGIEMMQGYWIARPASAQKMQDHFGSSESSQRTPESSVRPAR